MKGTTSPRSASSRNKAGRKFIATEGWESLALGESSAGSCIPLMPQAAPTLVLHRYLTSLLFPGLPTQVISGDLPLLFSALSCLFSPELLWEGKTEDAEQRRCFGGTTKHRRGA